MFISAAVLVFAWMLGLWVFQTRTRNAGIVDVGWTLSIAMAAWTHALLAPGAFSRKAVLTAMVTLWAARLGFYIAKRYLSEKSEDARYAEIRKGFKHQNLGFLGVFFFQAASALLLSTPFAFSAMNQEPSFSYLECSGIFLWCLGFAGESLADAQLKAFKKDPENKGKTCGRGLWKYSRHPNYFFEWVMWLAYYIYACASPAGWTSAIAPLLMFHFLVNVSGIPPAEAQALRSRGDEYRRYQEKTSSFIPWFPKK